MTNHVPTKASAGQLGGGQCSCGKGFATLKLAEDHAASENLAEANLAKAQLEKTADHVAPAQEPAVASETADSADAPVVLAERATEAPVVSEPAHQPHPPVSNAALVPATESQPQAIGPASLPLDLNHMSLNQINFIGQTMAKSGMFPDVTDASKALVKILAGQEIGVTPFQAMTNIHIIKGKATMGANLMAAKVKGTGKYDYRVVKMDATECSIDFFEIREGKRELIGNSPFTLEDATKAGTQNLDKFARNMLFARAMSNGVKWFTPDVFNGNLVYTPDELGAPVDEDGEIVGRAA